MIIKHGKSLVFDPQDTLGNTHPAIRSTIALAARPFRQSGCGLQHPQIAVEAADEQVEQRKGTHEITFQVISHIKQELTVLLIDGSTL